MTWAEEIRKARKAKGLTLEQAAEQIGVTWRTYCRWEAGDSVPNSRLVLEALEREGWPVPEGQT